MFLLFPIHFKYSAKNPKGHPLFARHGSRYFDGFLEIPLPKFATNVPTTAHSTKKNIYLLEGVSSVSTHGHYVCFRPNLRYQYLANEFNYKTCRKPSATHQPNKKSMGMVTHLRCACASSRVRGPSSARSRPKRVASLSSQAKGNESVRFPKAVVKPPFFGHAKMMDLV